jgi:hypothetical protein
MEEYWKEIKGYSNYQISNIGRVKSLKYNKEKIMIGGITSGYRHIMLRKNNSPKGFYIHKLMAMVFLNHELSGHRLVIDHINGNKLDNNIENLRIVTQRENVHLYYGKLQDSGKYRGVTFHNITNKWRSRIYINGKIKNLGLFDTQEKARDEYLKFIKNNLIADEL